MNYSRIESRLGECTLHRQVVVARSFHDDNRVLNTVLVLSLANLLHGQLKTEWLMLECSGFDEHVPEVVCHHPFGAVLGRVDTHDGETITTYLLDARANDAIGLLKR